MFGLKRKSGAKKPEASSNESATLSDRLKRTRTGLFGGLFSRNKTVIDNATLEELEDRLLLADIGVKTTDQVIQLLKAQSKNDSKRIRRKTHSSIIKTGLVARTQITVEKALTHSRYPKQALFDTGRWR